MVILLVIKMTLLVMDEDYVGASDDVVGYVRLMIMLVR